MYLKSGFREILRGVEFFLLVWGFSGCAAFQSSLSSRDRGKEKEWLQGKPVGVSPPQPVVWDSKVAWEELRREVQGLQERLEGFERQQAEQQNSFQEAQEKAFTADRQGLEVKKRLEALESRPMVQAWLLSEDPEEESLFRARLWVLLQEPERALQELSHWLESHPTSKRRPQALWQVGLALRALGREEEARGFWEELREVFPKSVEAKQVRGLLKGASKPKPVIRKGS